MSRSKARRLAAITGFLCACLSLPVRADPVVLLTSGTFDYNPNFFEGGLINFLGTDGFSLIGGAGSGSSEPTCCLLPGTATRLSGSWGGGDVNGVLTHLGQTFTKIGDANSNNTVNFTFISSTFTLPPAQAQRSTVTLSAPFALAGSFIGAPGDGVMTSPTVSLLFLGTGIGSLPFTFIPELGEWDPTGPALLTIGNPAEVVPEPGTLVLFGLGVAGAYGERYRRSHRTRRTES